MEENALYLRKSRADVELEAQGQFETLARHEKALLDLARNMSVPITHIYREIVSGDSIDMRPEVQKLLTNVESSRFKNVFVMEIERLARGNTIDQGIVAQAFQISGTRIVTPLKIYDPNNEFDEEYFEFGLFMARRELKTTTRRLQRGRLASVNEGKFIGSQAPYGYSKVKLQNEKGYTLLQNEDASTIKLIFDLYVNKNMGANLICDELDRLGIKPQNTNAWHVTSIRDILKNPVYMGKIRWSYKKETKALNEDGLMRKTRTRSKEYTLVDGLHEAIIDPETFEKAQAIRIDRIHPPVKGSDTLKNPLTGLIFCELCGAKMTRMSPNTKNPYATLKCSARGCKNVSAPMFLVEQKLLDSLDEWFKQYELNLKIEITETKNDISLASKEAALQQIASQTIKTKKQIENTYDFLEEGIYSKDEFLMRNKALSNKLVELKDKQLILEKEIKALSQSKKYKNDVIPHIKNLLDTYFLLPSAEEKNMLLRSIIEKVTYLKTEQNKKGQLANDNFELSIAPILEDME